MQPEMLGPGPHPFQYSFPHKTANLQLKTSTVSVSSCLHIVMFDKQALQPAYTFTAVPIPKNTVLSCMQLVPIIPVRDSHWLVLPPQSVPQSRPSSIAGCLWGWDSYQV